MVTMTQTRRRPSPHERGASVTVTGRPTDDRYSWFNPSYVFIMQDIKRRVASEMIRVVQPDGIILWYDFVFDSPKNSTVRGVGRREIQELFPRCDVELRRVTLAPPITRRLASRSRWLCSVLDAVPL